MNKIWLILFLATMTILAGCKKDEVFDYSDPDDYKSGAYSLIVNGRINKFNTRAGLESNGISVNWKEADNIGIFMKHEGGTVKLATYDVVAATINNSSNSARFNGSLEWQAAKTRHDFHAYTPAIIGQTMVPTNLPVSLPSSQKQIGATATHINALDVMIAPPLMLSSPMLLDDPAMNDPLNFMFDHVFVMQEFRFLAIGRMTKIQVKKITLTDANGKALSVDGGSIDLTQYASTDMFAKIDGGTKSSSVALDVAMQAANYIPTTLNPQSTTDPSSDTPNNVFTARLMMLPGDFTPAAEGDDNMKLSIEIGVFDASNTEIDTKIINIQYDGKLYERGKRYTSTYVLTKEGQSAGIGDPGVAWDGFTATKPTVFDAAAKTMEISTAAHLAWVAGIVNETISDADIADITLTGYNITITENINLGDKEWTPIGVTPTSAKTLLFGGTLDGNNKQITGLAINNPAVLYAKRHIGLFGVVKGAIIKDLSVQGNINVISTAEPMYVGGVAGWAPDSKNVPAGAKAITRITNCSFAGELKVDSDKSSSYVGGILGYAPTITNTTVYIEDCINYGNIEIVLNRAPSAFMPMYAGGIAGGATANIAGSLNLGNIKGTMGGSRLGGIVGQINNHAVRIEASANHGNITANGLFAVVGGVVAWSDKGFIISCYNIGDLTVASGGVSTGAYFGIGGISGAHGVGSPTSASPTLRGCYSTGVIKSDQDDFNGNIFGRLRLLSASAPNYDKIENNYYSNKPLISDANAEVKALKGVEQFSATTWPVLTDNGWAIGTGVDAPWMYLGAFGGNYPSLWWE